MTRRTIPVDTMRDCIARGMTCPDVADAMGFTTCALYACAKRHGLAFRPIPITGHSPEMMREIGRTAAPKRIAAIRAAKAAEKAHLPSWAELHAAGFTASEAAQARGTTTRGAHAAGVKLGLRWPQEKALPRINPAAGLTPEQRAQYDALANRKFSMAERLEIIGRGDLLRGTHRKVWRDPQQALAEAMARDAKRVRKAMAAAAMVDRAGNALSDESIEAERMLREGVSPDVVRRVTGLQSNQMARAIQAALAAGMGAQGQDGTAQARSGPLSGIKASA